MSTHEEHPDQAAAALERARGFAAQGNDAAAFIEAKKVAAGGHSGPLLLEAAQMFAALGHVPEATQAYLDAGAAFMDRDADFDSARDAFLAAHALDDQNLDVVFRLAQLDVHEGRVQDGMAKYIDVLRKSNLKHVPALFDTGCIYQSQGQHDQAILAFKKILDRDRKHVQALVHMGQLHQTKGMMPEAVGFYLQAAELSREQQQIDIARGLLTMVLQIEPGYTRARFLLDDLRETYGDLGAAPAAQVPAATPQPAMPSADAREASGLSGQASAEGMQAAATQAPELPFDQPALSSSLGEFAQLAAEAELASAREEAEEARRDADTLRAQLGEVKLALAATEERMRALQEAAHERTLAEAAQVAEVEVRLHELQRLANDEEARLEGVRAEWAAASQTLHTIEERTARARADIESRERHALQIAADLETAAAERARADDELARVRAAIADAEAQYDAAAARSTVLAEAHAATDDVVLGKSLLAQQQYERAAESFARALDGDANDAEAAYQLGVLYTEHLADPAKAEGFLERAAALRPEHLATYPALAVAKAMRGDVERALDMLQQFVRYDESQAPFLEYFVERLEQDAAGGATAARFRLGIAYRELGRIEEALVALQSIQREPEFEVLCHNAIGLCLRRQGLDTAAAKRFTKAIETPGYPDAQYHEALYNLGDLYEARGQDSPESLALALSAFEELYASDLTFRDVAERPKNVRAAMGAADNPKVKRLPQRSTDVG